MESRYSLIDITALLFFLCISLSNCLSTSQITVPQVGTMGLLFVAGILLVCSYFQLGTVKVTGIIFAIILFFISVLSYIYTGTLAAFRVFLFTLIARGLTYKKMISYNTALYNFYAASEVDKTSLHKACTKSVGFFAVWALETKVPKNISRCICQLIWLRNSCGLTFWYFAKCSSRYGSIFRLL